MENLIFMQCRKSVSGQDMFKKKHLNLLGFEAWSIRFGDVFGTQSNIQDEAFMKKVNGWYTNANFKIC